MRKKVSTRIGKKIVSALLLLIFILSFPLQSLAVPRSTQASQVRQQIEQIETEIQAKKAQLAAIDAQLEEMQVQLEIATERWKEAQDRLQTARTRQIEVRLKAEQTQAELKSKQEIFSKRVKILYKEGEMHFISIILNSEDMQDLFTRIYYIILITRSDTELIKAIETKKVELERIQEQLNEIVEEEQRAMYELEVRKLAIQAEQQRLENYKRSLSIDTQNLLAQLDELTKAQQQIYKSYYRIIPEAFGIQVEPGSIVETALNYLGIPYLWGGERPETGFDCSGLVRYVYLQHGIELPHYSGYQFKYGKPVEKSELMPGDLVFFGNPIHHVGIYIGNGYFIHAPKTGDFVKITPLESRKDYAGARRIIGYVMPTISPRN
ncbi:MAG: NlpC/P60 family protein [Actinobacteria bacterium]|nr:NlpC/P60 family protein [Actinomycetota bacterium]